MIEHKFVDKYNRTQKAEWQNLDLAFDFAQAASLSNQTIVALSVNKKQYIFINGEAYKPISKMGIIVENPDSPTTFNSSDTEQQAA